jgi:hypothetical protein
MSSMISMSQLIARRLRPALGAIDEAGCPADKAAAPGAPPSRLSSYGCTRLGLDRIDEPAAPLPPLLLPPAAEACGTRTDKEDASPGPEIQDAPPPPPPEEVHSAPLRLAAASPSVKTPPRPLRRSSFKLPSELHEALRQRARRTGRFQYQLVGEALEEYLSLES